MFFDRAILTYKPYPFESRVIFLHLPWYVFRVVNSLIGTMYKILYNSSTVFLSFCAGKSKSGYMERKKGKKLF